MVKGGKVIHPGVGAMQGSNRPQQEDPVYHGFYQWVGMVLFGQSLTFYMPHFLWKSCEGKKIERLVSGVVSPVASEDVRNRHKLAIAEYFHCNKRRHVVYGLRYWE